MSSKPIFFPARFWRRGGGEEARTTDSFIGLISVMGMSRYSRAIAIIAKIAKIAVIEKLRLETSTATNSCYKSKLQIENQKSEIKNHNSLNRICHHLAAAVAGGPASDHR